MLKNNCNAKVSQKNIIICVAETWHDHKISAEIGSKSLKNGITLNLDWGEAGLFIDNKKLFEDDL